MSSTSQRVSLLFQETINGLKSSGIALTPEDIVALWQESEKCVRGGSGDSAHLHVPVQVGHVTLWPRTIGAALWWERWGKEWFKDREDEILALGWLLAHARDRELLLSTTTKARAVARLLAWQLKIVFRLTLSDLAEGITRVFRQYDIDAATGERYACATSPDWGAVIAQLCATYHRRPEYFLWEVGERVAIEMLTKAPLPPGCTRAGTDELEAFAAFQAFKRRLLSKYGAGST